MPTYSHSRLSAYENCPFGYKLQYVDKIKRDTEGVEAFLGNCVHDTLKKCYDDIRRAKLDTPDELLSYYENLWEKNWHKDIVITRKDLTEEHYRNLGRKILAQYHNRHAPFDTDVTLGTELNLNFSLDAAAKYRFTGFIDRLSRSPDGAVWIHDYKTGAYLPGQAEADNDRQLALYQVGVRQRWPDMKDIRLVWHYLAFDCDLISCRTEESLATLCANTCQLIDRVEADSTFAPRESALCDWCDYPDLCPLRKHATMVDSLPPNKYLAEPGVALVNRFAELKQQTGALENEIEQVREALVDYARRQNVAIVRGSDRQVRIRFDTRLKFPGKNEPERAALDNAIIESGKWGEVSHLDTVALARIIEHHGWDKALIDRVMTYGRLEESCMVSLSRLKEAEE
jgi:putative RecB family exonuclease